MVCTTGTTNTRTLRGIIGVAVRKRVIELVISTRLELGDTTMELKSPLPPSLMMVMEVMFNEASVNDETSEPAVIMLVALVGKTISLLGILALVVIT